MAVHGLFNALDGWRGVEGHLKRPLRHITGSSDGAQAGDPVVVVGIGINLAQRAFPPELTATATSVRIESGRTVQREAMLDATLAAFDGWRAALEGQGFAAVRARWLELADTIGRAVSSEECVGVATDLDAEGALVVRDHAGKLHHVVAGELGAVSPRVDD